MASNRSLINPRRRSRSIISRTNDTNEPTDLSPPSNNSLSSASTNTTTQRGQSPSENIPDAQISLQQLNQQYQNWELALKPLIHKFEIKKNLDESIRQLQAYKVIFVCDDSGSMDTTFDSTGQTRWNALREIIKILIRFIVIFDPEGVDIYFFNRRNFYNVKSPEEVDQAFNEPPNGYSTLVNTLKTIFELATPEFGCVTKQLVFVATDGEVTDEDGEENIGELYHLMIHERHVKTTHVAFLLLTDDKDYVRYFTDWNQKIQNMDVTYDLQTQRNRFRKTRGPGHRLTYGDYIVKLLLGSIDRRIKEAMQ